MTAPALALLYRGELASCNYDCGYCPFAKRKDSRASIARDAADLDNFVDWASRQQRPLNILFTPWGEALTRKHYREAIIALSQMPQVQRVAVQTNLATAPHWIERGDAGKISLWCTFHPTETSHERFLRRLHWLAEHGVPHSVGMVGMREFFGELGALREALSANTYLWVNAYWDEGPDYYQPAERRWLEQIDPWFIFNAAPSSSFNATCQAGESVLSIDGSGNLRRCHFVPEQLGNLYTTDWRQALKRRACPNTLCDCYIGYVHRDELPFRTQFGVGALGRVPAEFKWAAPAGWQAQGPAPVSERIALLQA